MSQFHPIIEQWFASRFPAPTEPQRLGWPAITRGEHVLIAAPTGSGKTLTAFLAVIDRLLRRSLKEKLGDGIRVVYVSPLRALSNDMHRNLDVPLREITELVELSGLRTIHGEQPAPIRVGLRTGDTSSSQRATLVRKPPHILVTTPESLYLLLTSVKGRAALRKTEVVIVDEIHALVRDKRGSHLSLSLERLQALCKKPLQRIGLSATQRPIERMAEFLGGSAERRQPTADSRDTVFPAQLALPFEREEKGLSACGGSADGDRLSAGVATIIDVGHSRHLDLAIEVPEMELGAVCSHEHWGQINARVVELINSHRSTLVFVNTRRMAERVAHQLTELLGEDKVRSHHGSLSAELRLRTERRLKDGELKCVVATASLELGIDIGYIDLVIQLGSPGAIATFLQRIGRAGHAVKATPKGRLFALTRDELIEAMALMRAIRAGRLDVIPIPVAPLDVLAQQIVAEVAACEECSSDELFEMFCRAYPYREMTREQFDSVVQIMAEGITDTSGRGKVYLHHDRVKRRIKARPAARIAATMNAGAIPDIGSYRVVADPDGVVVGTIDEDFAVESQRGDIFLLGSTSWRFQGIRKLDVVVTDAGGAPPSVPFWRGEAPGRSWELSEEVSRLREDISLRLGGEAIANGKWQMADCKSQQQQQPTDNVRLLTSPPPPLLPSSPPPLSPSLQEWLQTETLCNAWAAEQIANYAESQKAAIGVIPTQKQIVFERFFDESGGMQMVVHAPFGARVCKAWGLAMRKRFCRSFDFELQATADDDGFILSLGPQHSFPLESMFPMLNRENARNLLEQAILQTPLFQTRWRWNMNRALLVLKMRNGQKVPPALQRFRSDDLLTAVFPKLTGCQENIVGDHELPDHPLVQQTMHDCLTEAMDLAGLHHVLEEIEAGRIELIARDTREPSPFCYELLNANPYAFLDGGEVQERRARAVANRRTLNPDDVRDLAKLDPAAIEQVVREAQPLIRNEDELHDALLSLFFMPVTGTNEMFNPNAIGVGAGVGVGASVTAGAQSDSMAAHAVGVAVKQLISDRRATRLTLPNGQLAWVAAERVPAIRVLFPTAAIEPAIDAPPGVRTEWETTDARLSVLRGWLEVCGPITAEELAQQTTFTESQVFVTLEALEGEGTVLRGKFRALEDGVEPPLTRVEWCHRRLLARIHRLTIEGLRRLIEPVDVSTYWRYLARRQGITGTDRRTGSNGLFEIIAMLQGLDLAAVAWERDVLPARVENYRPEWLDELCLGGEVAWGRLYPPRVDADKSKPMSGVTRVVPVSLFLRGDLPWLDAPGRTPEADSREPQYRFLSSSSEDLAALLRTRGAMFLTDLLRESRLLPAHLEDGLGELVSRGLVTADGFSGLRQLISDASRAAASRGANRGRPGLLRQRGAMSSVGRWSLWRDVTPAPSTGNMSGTALAAGETAGTAASAQRRSLCEPMALATGRGWVTLNGESPDASAFGSQSECHWASTVPLSPLPRNEVIEQWAWQLLRRWGVMFKDLLIRESGAPSWWELLQVYRRLEARGEIRGGRFISGVAGEQFSMSESIRQLRLLRDGAEDKTTDSENQATGREFVLISAADPLNLVGILDNQPRVPSIASHRMVYLGGRCVGTLIADEKWLSPTLNDESRSLVVEFLDRGRPGENSAVRKEPATTEHRTAPARLRTAAHKRTRKT
ncbi:MAG: DEAD/DEAH box helicase [Planctomycetaceae bacterium]